MQYLDQFDYIHHFFCILTFTVLFWEKKRFSHARNVPPNVSLEYVVSFLLLQLLSIVFWYFCYSYDEDRCCCWCVEDRFKPYSRLWFSMVVIFWYWFDSVITKLMQLFGSLSLLLFNLKLYCFLSCLSLWALLYALLIFVDALQASW